MHSPATLPNEIIIEISSHLSLGQKSNFSRTCKRLDALIEPQIWADLELHAKGYHDSRDEIKHPPPFKSPSDRVYRCYHYRGGVSPLNTLRQLVETRDQDRLRILASRVRSLCSVIDTGDKIWNILPYCVNLEVLELNARWDEVDQRTNEVRLPPLPKLRFAKLLGYIPRAGARWILRSGPTLERLELGMLDRPIQTSLWFDRDLAPLPEENLAGPNEAPDYGSLNCELVHPRPLGGFLPEEGVSLPLLQHLYLCSTAHRKHTYYAEDEGWSSRAEEASAQDWIDILMASRQTLETLVLEHKLTIPESETEDRGEEEIMRDFHTNNDGGGSSKLADVLEAVAIHDTEEFPELTHVYFYGIVVSKGLDSSPSEERPVGRVMKRLGEEGVTCEARRGQWLTFVDDDGWTDSADCDALSDSSYGSQESERRIHWDEVIASVQGAD
ncbi:hypothetical protein BHE90_006938 [Fusarium euwallaceae]|uniref:F-box domain-containing protein n=1 Tax=Fusarium euwallaceae TaxID=1147111 RepID=A0A430LSD0_9HYPO|nr:hypothetical protein BHE90_006938 [Fusarium euwallaceae]